MRYSPRRDPASQMATHAQPTAAVPAGADGSDALDAAFLGALALMVACHLLAARLALGWRTAVATDGLLLLYFAALALRPAWRGLLLRLFTLGVVAGLLELVTDAAGQRVVHSLTYPPGEPLLWTSPLYMPLSWALVLMLLGYFGWRLGSRLPSLPLAMLLTGLAGAVLVPFYEEMAYFAGWWRYLPAPAVDHVPVYVVVFEGAVAALLPLLTRRLPERPLAWAALAGFATGLWMPVAALLAWLVLGR
jgi:hypothetical protein